MKLKKFDINYLGRTFLGSILLVFYRTNQINKWQVVKFYNKLSKDSSPKDLQTITEVCKCVIPENAVIVCSEDGKYAPLMTIYIIIDGQKTLLPITEKDDQTIMAHLEEEGVNVLTIKEAEWQ